MKSLDFIGNCLGLEYNIRKTIGDSGSFIHDPGLMGGLSSVIIPTSVVLFSRHLGTGDLDQDRLNGELVAIPTVCVAGLFAAKIGLLNTETPLLTHGGGQDLESPETAITSPPSIPAATPLVSFEPSAPIHGLPPLIKRVLHPSKAC